MRGMQEYFRNPFGIFTVGQPWGYDHGFRMDVESPSQVVQLAIARGLILYGDHIVDLGSGQNPRNAIFLATNMDCCVDGVDLAPAVIPPTIPVPARERITLQQGSVMDFELRPDTYQAAILTRLIQYLSTEQLIELMLRVHDSLTDRGALILSYTASGGILNRTAEYQIQAYAHPIDTLETLLEDIGFIVLSRIRGADHSTNVPHAGEVAVTYDILAERL